MGVSEKSGTWICFVLAVIQPANLKPSLVARGKGDSWKGNEEINKSLLTSDSANWLYRLAAALSLLEATATNLFLATLNCQMATCQLYERIMSQSFLLSCKWRRRFMKPRPIRENFRFINKQRDFLFRLCIEQQQKRSLSKGELSSSVVSCVLNRRVYLSPHSIFLENFH